MYTRICYGKKDMLFNYSEFICDTESDILNLPTSKRNGTEYATCSPGSKALVLETKKLYVLANNDRWIEVLDYTNTHSGSIDVATVDEANNYLEIGVI